MARPSQPLYTVLPVPILSRINPIHALYPILRYSLIPFSRLCLHFASVLLPLLFRIRCNNRNRISHELLKHVSPQTIRTNKLLNSSHPEPWWHVQGTFSALSGNACRMDSNHRHYKAQRGHQISLHTFEQLTFRTRIWPFSTTRFMSK
jgi:hypothetical protein